MKRTLVILIAFACSALILSGCETDGDSAASPNETTTGTTAPQSEPTPDKAAETDSKATVLTVQTFLSEDTFQVTGEEADDLVYLLNHFNYDRGTNDGIPEYTILCPGEKRFDLNLSSGWALRMEDEKECELTENEIAEISTLLSKGENAQ